MAIVHGILYLKPTAPWKTKYLQSENSFQLFNIERINKRKRWQHPCMTKISPRLCSCCAKDRVNKIKNSKTRNKKRKGKNIIVTCCLDFLYAGMHRFT